MNLLAPHQDPNRVPTVYGVATYPRTPYTFCPICGNEEFKPLRSDSCIKHALYRPGLPNTIDWMKCEKCGHVFTSGYFSGEAEKFLFEKTQESQQPGYNLEQGRYVAADMVERIRSASGLKGGTWLDVGFGAGHLLTTAEEYGYQVSGTDLRQQSCDTLGSFGYDVGPHRLQDIQGANEYNIISMADVLEHIPFPIEALKAAHRLLRHEGVLFVSCPNMDSFVWKALDRAKQNPFWGELEHLHNFGYGSLNNLLLDNGFGVIQYNVSRRYRCCQELITRKLIAC